MPAMTRQDCREQRKTCPGRKTLSTGTLVPIFLALFAAVGCGLLANAHTSEDLQATKTEVRIRAETQAEMRRDLKQVLSTVTEISTTVKLLETESRK